MPSPRCVSSLGWNSNSAVFDNECFRLVLLLMRIIAETQGAEAGGHCFKMKTRRALGLQLSMRPEANSQHRGRWGGKKRRETGFLFNQVCLFHHAIQVKAYGTCLSMLPHFTWYNTREFSHVDFYPANGVMLCCAIFFCSHRQVGCLYFLAAVNQILKNIYMKFLCDLHFIFVNKELKMKLPYCLGSECFPSGNDCHCFWVTHQGGGAHMCSPSSQEARAELRPV